LPSNPLGLALEFGGAKQGLAIWNHPIAAYLLEITLVFGGVWLCLRVCGISGFAGWGRE